MSNDRDSMLARIHAGHDALQPGDRVRSYDHEPREGVAPRYVVGHIVDKTDDGRLVIIVEQDTTFPEHPRKVVATPIQLFIGEWLGRITMEGSEVDAENDAAMMAGCEVFARFGYSPLDRELWIQSEGTLSISAQGSMIASIARANEWVRR